MVTMFSSQGEMTRFAVLPLIVTLGPGINAITLEPGNQSCSHWMEVPQRTKKHRNTKEEDLARKSAVSIEDVVL